MKHDQLSEVLATAPHQYQHDLVLPATYLIVKPVKGHSTIFRIRKGFSLQEGLSTARRRGFRVLYAVHAKPPASSSRSSSPVSADTRKSL